jgi:hypothetical protein
MLEQLGSKDFLPHLHTIFTVESAGNTELEMIEVSDQSNQHVEQFSVYFAGPASPWLQQDSYTLQHPQMGTLTLFMGPKGPTGGRMIYEVGFSRLIDRASSSSIVV